MISKCPSLAFLEKLLVPKKVNGKYPTLQHPVDLQCKLILQCSWLQCSPPFPLGRAPLAERDRRLSRREARNTKSPGEQRVRSRLLEPALGILTLAYGENFPCNIISTPLRVRILFPL